MPDFLSFIKPSVRRSDAYTLKHFQAQVKINQNENPFDMPEAVKSSLISAIAQKPWSRYPPFVPDQLIERLARFSNWKPQGILVGNGSNELIEAVLMVTVEPGKRVAIPQPTFTLYRLLANILGGQCEEIPLTSALVFDVPRLVEASRSVDLTILCSPNNPTGCVLNLDELRAILRVARGLVIVDEAYHEFSRQSVVPLLHEFKNLIVLRTFSKAMAMAGLRVGYLLTHPELAVEVSKAKLPYNLNILSMAAAEAALAHFDLLEPLITAIIEERQRVYEELIRIPHVRPYPSQANFIVFDTEAPPSEIFDALYSDGILVRDVSRYPMLAKSLRVSIGTRTENNQFLNSLKKAVAS